MHSTSCSSVTKSVIVAGLSLTFGIGFFTWRKWVETTTKRKIDQRSKRVVVISGCDSGLGLSMAYWAGKLGYYVIAGCLSDNSEGANYLKKTFPDNNYSFCHAGSDEKKKLKSSTLHVLEVDVTDETSIHKFVDQCRKIVQDSHGQLKLWAIVCNAAVAVCGEFFWQTRDQQQRQMKVNFWGSINFTSAMKPLLFKYKPRLIIISSDCADYPLPGFSIYCASKAALESWATSLRLELAKFGICVTSYQPGAFASQSRIMSSHGKNYSEMKNGMSNSDLEFYGNYFEEFHESKLLDYDVPSPIKPIDDDTSKYHFITLLEKDLSHTPVYIYDPPMNRFFHFLLRYLPQRSSDKLLNKIICGKASWTPVEYDLFEEADNLFE